MTECPWQCVASTRSDAGCHTFLKTKMSSCSRVVGVVQEGQTNGRSPRYGQSGGPTLSEVEKVVLEQVALGDLPFQTVLVDGSKALVIVVVLDELVAEVGG